MKKIINWNRFIVILVIAIIVAGISILHVIVGYAKTPGGMVYLWTGHYYLDYFEYVQAIVQGMRGKWLWENYFATDDPTRSFLGIWQYLLLGKIGKIFHLDPISTYWLEVFLFSFIFAILIFQIIKKLMPDSLFVHKLCAFFLSLFAAPFYQIVKDSTQWKLISYGFWNDRNIFWERFESIPYHTISHILSLLVILLLADSLEKAHRLTSRSVLFRGLLGGFILIYLLLFSPSSALLLILTIFLVTFVYSVWSLKQKQKKYQNLILFAGIIFVLVIPVGILIRNHLNSTASRLVLEFESGWQERPGFRLMILTLGPVLIASFFGISNFLMRMTAIRFIFLSLLTISYGIFFSPVASYLGTTNTRFLTPLSYILFSTMAVLRFKSARSAIVVTFILLLFFLPANIEGFRSILNDRNISSPISYLPKGIIEGFRYLDKISEKGNALTTPSQFLGSVLPIYTDRHVYVARHNTTPNYIEKNIRASNFYLGTMTKGEALEFLSKNNLKFVVLTSIEGYEVKPLYLYSFLKEIYKNKDIVIFEVKKS